MHNSRLGERAEKNSFYSQRRKRIAFVLLGLFALGVGAIFGSRLHAASFDYVYPPDKEVLVSHFFEPANISLVSAGETITVTIDVINEESADLRGFYYSDQVPNGWSVGNVTVSVGGSPIADYTYEQGPADEVYTGLTPHRWALEMPQGDETFSPIHPIPGSGGAAQIVYTMMVNGGIGSDYSVGHEAWAGWLEEGATGTAVFGYRGVTGPLSAAFTADSCSGETPLLVQFTDSSTGNPTAWAWDFGDETTISSQQHPTHTYTVPGSYDVTLTITRTDPTESDTIVKTDFITVSAPSLRADFTAQPRFGLPPLAVQFTDQSTGDVLTYTWSFGDETTSSSPDPEHTYGDLGYYTVSLTVQDAYTSSTLMRALYIHVTDTIYYVYLPMILRSHVH